MRKALIVLSMAILILASLVGVQGEEESPYPTITVIFSDGQVYDIKGDMWSMTIIPYVVGLVKNDTGFDWNKHGGVSKIFFDSALKGLNPYGADFINAISKYTYDEFQNNVFLVLSRAFNSTANLDSDRDGYSNIDELSQGYYPGDPESYPGQGEQTFWEENQGYIIILVLIGSVFVMYFVFNKESEKERI